MTSSGGAMSNSAQSSMTSRQSPDRSCMITGSDWDPTIDITSEDGSQANALENKDSSFIPDRDLRQNK